jgi:uncharacterized protein DUF5681
MAKRAQPSGRVGYKNPPRHTQFRPGQSGNPAGRPKGSRNLMTAVKKELAKHITVTEKGKQRNIPKLQAMATQLVNKAIQDPKLLVLVLKALGPQDEETAASQEPSVFDTPEDEKVYESILARLRQMAAPTTLTEPAGPSPASVDAGATEVTEEPK